MIPTAFGTEAYGINDAGQLSVLLRFNGKLAWVRFEQWVHHRRRPRFSGTEVTAINNTGAIVGQCWHTAARLWFLYSGGSYTIYPIPIPTTPDIRT
jgi:hypothetical protein